LGLFDWDDLMGLFDGIILVFARRYGDLMVI
jgi:hypothetical protein